jgi:site-specific DNA recombinase
MAKIKKLKPITALYVRTSTAYQDTGAEAQELKLRQYCELKGLKKIKLYIDKDQSGKKRSRPQLNKLLRDIKSGEINSVVTYSMSRLGRSTKHLLELSDMFQDHDVEFVSLSESIDTSTPTGRLFYTILGAFSQFEREVISERVKAGLANAKAKGKKCGGHNKKRNSELIIALREEGMSLRAIAKKAKCSLGSVVDELKEVS